jgi:cytochrome oxidase Cu insertion factor (SCO1/SenC/PrrC family)
MLARIVAVVVVLFIEVALLPGQTFAQSAATNDGPGLAVGLKAPAFKLVGQDGKDHALSQLLLKGKLALVFQRSADW